MNVSDEIHRPRGEELKTSDPWREKKNNKNLVPAMTTAAASMEAEATTAILD